MVELAQVEEVSTIVFLISKKRCTKNTFPDYVEKSERNMETH